MSQKKIIYKYNSHKYKLECWNSAVKTIKAELLDFSKSLEEAFIIIEFKSEIRKDFFTYYSQGILIDLNSLTEADFTFTRVDKFVDILLMEPLDKEKLSSLDLKLCYILSNCNRICNLDSMGYEMRVTVYENLDLDDLKF